MLLVEKDLWQIYDKKHMKNDRQKVSENGCYGISFYRKDCEVRLGKREE
jgi:hypothetical protein|nr:hypothetical protein [uncultured Acetatifactor sp.]